VDAATWLGASGVGLIACALLMVNNIRDIPTDALVGKRTLAVRLGDRRARAVFAAMVTAPLLAGLAATLWYPWAALVLLLAPAAAGLSRPVLAGRAGRDLIPVLRNTGLYEIAYALLLGLGLVL